MTSADRIGKVSIHTMAIDAFMRMHRGGLSSLAIVDDDDETNEILVDTLSASDLKGFAKSSLSALTQPLSTFLAHSRRTIGHNAHKQLVVCFPDTPFLEALEMVLKERVHRIFILENEGRRPLGVVSLTDMLRQIASTLVEDEDSTKDINNNNKTEETISTLVICTQEEQNSN